MNYWYDRATGRAHYAMVVLCDIEDPDAVSMIVQIPDLLRNDRFMEIPVDSVEYAKALSDAAVPR